MHFQNVSITGRDIVDLRLKAIFLSNLVERLLLCSEFEDIKWLSEDILPVYISENIGYSVVEVDCHLRY